LGHPIKSRRFQEPSFFGDGVSGYKLLPFRFIALDSEREVLVSESAEYLIAARGTARRLATHSIDPSTDIYRELRSRHFLYDDQSSPLLDVLATKYRTKRSFLDGFTKLHIFVTTLRCEHSCLYCQVSRQSTNRVKYDMSRETADRALNMMFRSPAPHLTLEFQGGEPLLNFDLIRYIVPLAKNQAARIGKQLDIVVATNLAVVTDEMLLWFRDEGVDISTSLDGPEFIHNANRPRPCNNSHALAVANIERARNVVGFDHVAALMTTTKLSLDHPIEIIDEYLRLGFRSIFLRPISPYGFAIKTAKRIGYETDRFLTFYRAALSHIIELNRSGTDFGEAYAKILLTKMLTPFPTRYVDLQSPAGAAINVVVYNYDGDVYASDESRMLAEMGDTRFRLGNVHTDDFRDIFGSERVIELVESSLVECLPGCVDCAFQPFCGGDPVFNYATQKDLIGHRPTSAFCRRNMEMIRHLFSLLATEDPQLFRIFFAWIREKSLGEIGIEVAQ
jgi:His-Xaa-Ser system radical SAM maturase HxsB